MLRALVEVTLVFVPLLAALHPLALARRWRELLVTGATCALLAGALAAAGPMLLRRVVLPGYNLDVDHRPRPFSGDTNEDGIRSRWSPSDFKSDEFNIIVLGDSFTFASAVTREQAFPSLVEERLRALLPDKRIRVANFGWISSSPLLQLRQLRQIGARYKPDLVIQCFDMTDFHDDLTYTEAFHDEGVAAPGDRITIFRAFGGTLSLLLGVNNYGDWLKGQLAYAPPPSPFKVDKPNQRFFFLFQPMEDSERHAEISWSALRDTEAEARRLGARYALFVMPRYQQYNPKECPRDREKVEFPEDDRYLLEPFRYFEKKSKEVSFPIHSLLGAFRDCGVFPTSPPDDTHWNAAGNRVAADAIVKVLVDDHFFD
jgi:hypothetical protein